MSSPDILVSNSYYLKYDQQEQRIMRPYAALGPLYIAAYLRREGFNVAMHDCTFSEGEHEYAAVLDRLTPKVVGISSLITSRHAAGRMIKLAKERGIKVIVGGPDATSSPELYLGYGADYVVLSEGEVTAHMLMNRLLGRDLGAVTDVAGLAYLEDGKVTFTAPRGLIKSLETTPIPWPAYDLIDMERYFSAWQGAHGFTSMHMMTARGCPFTCAWCSRDVFGRSFRHRSGADVASELRHLMDDYKIDRLWIADDLVGINKKWMAEWHQSVTEAGAMIPFECLSRVDIIDETMLKQLKEMGCVRIYVGAESGSQRVLDAMNKKTQVEDIYKASELMKAAAIERGFFMMFGYPPEDRSDMKLTRKMLLDIQPEMTGFSVAYPLKGTEFYKLVEDQVPAQDTWHQTNENRVLFQARYSTAYYALTIKYMRKLLEVKRNDPPGWGVRTVVHVADQPLNPTPLRRLKLFKHRMVNRVKLTALSAAWHVIPLLPERYWRGDPRPVNDPAAGGPQFSHNG